MKRENGTVHSQVQRHTLVECLAKVLSQVVDYFGYVEPFIRENEEICPANRQHLLEIFDDPQSLLELRMHGVGCTR